MTRRRPPVLQLRLPDPDTPAWPLDPGPSRRSRRRTWRWGALVAVAVAVAVASGGAQAAWQRTVDTHLHHRAATVVAHAELLAHLDGHDRLTGDLLARAADDVTGGHHHDGTVWVDSPLTGRCLTLHLHDGRPATTPGTVTDGTCVPDRLPQADRSPRSQP